MTFIITEPCRDSRDKSCVEVCPVDCIYEPEGSETLLIHPGECIDCALCVDVCPVQAIYAEAEVPTWLAEAIERNYRAFGVERGNPADEPDDRA